MEPDVLEVTVESVGNKIEFRQSRGGKSFVCSVKTRDKIGNEFKAYAWESNCDNLITGDKVLITKSANPEHVRNNFIVVKNLKNQ
jgi:predicted nucleic acid-binding protein